MFLEQQRMGGIIHMNGIQVTLTKLDVLNIGYGCDAEKIYEEAYQRQLWLNEVMKKKRVSKEDIEKAYKEGSGMWENTGMSLKDNPFKRINKRLAKAWSDAFYNGCD